MEAAHYTHLQEVYLGLKTALAVDPLQTGSKGEDHAPMLGNR